MLHTEVFEKYKKIFVEESVNVEIWHPNGFNSIRIRFFSKDEYVFCYINDRAWSIETLDNFIMSIKNKKNL
jgi:hypothetical protein